MANGLGLVINMYNTALNGGWLLMDIRFLFFAILKPLFTAYAKKKQSVFSKQFFLFYDQNENGSTQDIGKIKEFS